jgi:hypothetical protein
MGHLIAAGIEAVTYGQSDQVKPPDHYVEIDKLLTHSKVLALSALQLSGGLKASTG